MLFGKSERVLYCPTLNETQTLCCHFLHQTHSKESSVTDLLQVIHVSHSSSSGKRAGKLVGFLLGCLAPQIFSMISSFFRSYNKQKPLLIIGSKRKGTSAEANVQYSKSCVSLEIRQANHRCTQELANQSEVAGDPLFRRDT